MKSIRKIFLLFIYAGLSYSAFAQEFSFPLFFADANGNHDTIFLGYDLNATDTIDPEFGENNIISNPWNNSLDVRIGEVKDADDWNNIASLFQSKKQIVKKTCNFYRRISINIYCNSYPIVIKWDTSYFINDSCRMGSQIDSYPEFWWDVYFGDIWAFLSTDFFAYHTDSLVIDSIGYGSAPFYYTDNDKSIAMLFFSFSHPDYVPWLGLDELKSQNKTFIYPNPTFDKLNVLLENCIYKEIRVMLYSSDNRLILDKNMPLPLNNQIQLNTLTLDNGVYFIRLLNKNEIIATKKIVKLK